MSAASLERRYHPAPAGQGLLEATLAIGMILVGLGAVLSLTLQNVSATNASSQRLIAAQLAREAIEAVRAQRDSNWLAAGNSRPTQVWDDGVCSNSFTACKVDGDCGTGNTCRVLHDSSDCTVCNAAIVAFTPGDPAPPPKPGKLAIAMLSDMYPSPSRDVDGSSMPGLELYRQSQYYDWVQFGSDVVLPGYNPTGYRRIVLLDPVCSNGTTVETEVGSYGCPNDSWTKIGVRVEATLSWPAAGVFGNSGRRKLTLVEYLYNWR